MATPQRTARIEDEIWDPASAKAASEGTTCADIMRASLVRYLAGGLTSQGTPASQPSPDLTSQQHVTSQHVTSQLPAGGIPSPGVACMWPACWARDTSRYGVSDPGELARRGYRDRPRDEDKVGIPLCPAHAARLGGLIYRRKGAA